MNNVQKQEISGNRHHFVGQDERVPSAFERFAFGVALGLTLTDEGGRRTPLASGAGIEARFTHRPNWGLLSGANSAR